ncbi:hypothetical protein PUMCH_001020 [Australozyma saopauloensis]|uniref:PSP proline-rich domain-containing protein n=1 Tax=Australozyma saopauloensis TaxID=291208 RepID=A0AAX4H5Z7_9ASCO|nr:hypothetical protein PUMCH_001020 [[Candida] saopauloensis]
MGPKRSKNQIRREKAKLRKLAPDSKEHEPTKEVAPQNVEEPSISTQSQQPQDGGTKDEHDEKEQTIDSGLASEFTQIFKKFDSPTVNTPGTKSSMSLITKELELDTLSESDDDEQNGSAKTMSRSQRKELSRVPMSELKASISKPQTVEWFDSNAPDPYLVVLLRTRINHVDVPGHWQQKKDYLSAKRGTNKPQYTLPKFIRDTGISEMRNHDPESLKKLQRDRVQPKMNKLDIDYQRLFDAFFKHQSKPRLLAFGELYSEGKEKTDKYRQEITDIKPGKISKELRAAIGMPENESGVPPWITLMQELGKPPSYRLYIIPGVDTEYKNTGYTLPNSVSTSVFNNNGDVWGLIEEGEETGPETDLSDEDDDDDDAVAEDPDLGVDSDNGEVEEEKPQRVEITEFSGAKSTLNEGVLDKVKKIGELFTVIKEKTVNGGDGLVSSNLAYEIPKLN